MAKALQAPRWWLSAGLLCFAASVLIGYHQDQRSADSALAGKVPLPPAVRIQDYDSGRHSNTLHEVRLVAEVGTPDAVQVEIASVDAAKPVTIVPVYPVGDAAEPLAARYLAAEAEARGVRPPRGTAETPPAMHDTPVALLVSSRLDDDLTVIGAGSNGPLVEVLGAEIAEEALRDAALAELRGRGLDLIEGLPVVRLYAGGVRPMPAVADYSTARRVLDLMCIAMVLVGFALAVVPRTHRRRARTDESFEEVPAVGELPGVFAPIRAQEELLRAEQDESERRAAATRRVISRAIPSNS